MRWLDRIHGDEFRELNIRRNDLPSLGAAILFIARPDAGARFAFEAPDFWRYLHDRTVLGEPLDPEELLEGVLEQTLLGAGYQGRGRDRAEAQEEPGAGRRPTARHRSRSEAEAAVIRMEYLSAQVSDCFALARLSDSLAKIGGADKERGEVEEGKDKRRKEVVREKDVVWGLAGLIADLARKLRFRELDELLSCLAHHRSDDRLEPVTRRDLGRYISTGRRWMRLAPRTRHQFPGLPDIEPRLYAMQAPLVFLSAGTSFAAAKGLQEKLEVRGVLTFSEADYKDDPDALLPMIRLAEAAIIVLSPVVISSRKSYPLVQQLLEAHLQRSDGLHVVLLLDDVRESEVMAILPVMKAIRPTCVPLPGASESGLEDLFEKIRIALDIEAKTSRLPLAGVPAQRSRGGRLHPALLAPPADQRVGAGANSAIVPFRCG